MTQPPVMKAALFFSLNEIWMSPFRVLLPPFAGGLFFFVMPSFISFSLLFCLVGDLTVGSLTHQDTRATFS